MSPPGSRSSCVSARTTRRRAAWRLDDACRAATALAAAGAALIDVSGGLQGSRGVGGAAAYFVPYAQRIKAAVGVPVMVTGGIGDPDLADRIVREGWADLVGVGRAMLNDPNWAAKAIRHLSATRATGQTSD